MISIVLAALGVGAVWAGWRIGGLRGAAIVAALLAMVWVAERVAASYEAEAEAARLSKAAERSEAAFRDFREASGRAAESAAAQIREIEAARAAAETALAASRQSAAAEFAALRRRIESHVPARSQCDYRQPVLDGVFDAYARASR